MDRRSRIEDVQERTAAENFLLLLRSAGIGNFFVNAGTDFAPLVAAYTRMIAEGENPPRPIVAGHENLAMGMAHGAYLMTGEPQAVMFHMGVGTANASCAAFNAAAERVPLIIAAGRSPVLEGGMLGSRDTRVAWAQEMFDQASLVREAVKWDYELRNADQLDAVVGRALEIARAQPAGPVYLALPREVLAGPAPALTSTPSSFQLGAAVVAPDSASIDILADRIVAAQMPLISSLASGADPSTLPLLASLCDEFAIGFVEEQSRYLNLPCDHPMHFGFSMNSVFPDADLLCFVESDVPWIPNAGEPRDSCFIAQCGIDPYFQRYPMRTHASDLRIIGSAREIYAMLGDALRRRKDEIDPERRVHMERMAGQRSRNQCGLSVPSSGAISRESASIVLAECLHDACTVFNEYWGVRQHLTFRQPQSYFYLPAPGGLGWAIPAAIGAKIAAPRRTMIALIGDGTYMFSNPAACHHASQKHGAPMLTLVYNDASWNAVRATSDLMYGGRYASDAVDTSLYDLSPSPQIEKYVEASGGYGEAVSDIAELKGAILRGLGAVEREGRQALIAIEGR